MLFDQLEKSGWQWVVFNEEHPDKNNCIIECILDAMVKFKNDTPCNCNPKDRELCNGPYKRCTECGRHHSAF